IYTISKVKTYQKHIKPPPPFITATLQQEASHKLGFSSKQTMFIAQQLFEGVKLKDEVTGLITYPRTDSLRIADEFIAETRKYISEQFGEAYLPDTPRKYKEKGISQGAHEAIRPTSILRTPQSIKQYLLDEQFKLYDLIYRRFLASQMSDAIYIVTDLEVSGVNSDTQNTYLFKTQGIKQKFDGFEKIYADSANEKFLPALKKNEEVILKAVNPEQHFTQPPARYSEATLIKKLQINGIGRPSTYATIVSTIIERRYVEKKHGRLIPTKLGFLVADILIPNFDNIFEVNFTKRMEKELDLIEENKVAWQNVVRDFYMPFKKDLEKIQDKTPEILKVTTEYLEEFCPICGKHLMVKWGKFGRFISCSGFPQCKYIKKEVAKEPQTVLEEKCPQCGRPLVERHSRYGKFNACSGDPECKYIQHNLVPKEPPKLLNKKCPKCKRQLVERKGRFGNFIACSGYPDCTYRRAIKKS
ncbi:MAG: DNA topoisomerase, partial [candidate division WOR-3 bacterium]|nr:DNA topoisomerase [candidate division WOR-3 bacterium]